jgi:hypothetical protein
MKPPPATPARRHEWRFIAAISAALAAAFCWARNRQGGGAIYLGDVPDSGPHDTEKDGG